MQKDWLTREGCDVTTAILSLLAWLNKEKPGIPVVIMTEYASYTDAVKAIKMGAKDYLPKPVHSERLFEIVKELVHPVVTIQHSLERLFQAQQCEST